MMDYQKTAREVLRSVGGNENVYSVIHCVTRLRFKLKDNQLPDKEKLNRLTVLLPSWKVAANSRWSSGMRFPKYTRLFWIRWE